MNRIEFGDWQGNWQKIAIGAVVRRKRREWTVTKHTKRETSVQVLMASGRRQICVNIPVCITGPILWEVGLHPVRPAPSQTQMRLS
jgi:hypothetical protein